MATNTHATPPFAQPAIRSLVIGGASIDIIVEVNIDSIAAATSPGSSPAKDEGFLHIALGSKIEATRIRRFFGGGAANVAAAQRKLGLSVAFAGKIGADDDGTAIRNHLAGLTIDIGALRVNPAAPTGVSIIMASQHHNPALFVTRGANGTLAPGEIADHAFNAADLCHIAPLSNQSAAAFASYAAQAKAAGCFVVSNPGIRQLARFGAAYRQSLPLIDLICVNRSEASALSALWGNKPAADMAAELPASLPALLQGLQAHGGTAILITDGGRGSYLFWQDILYFCPAIPGEIVAAVGAGDCYGATLGCLLAAGTPAPAAMRLASLNALSVAQSLDTQTGQLDWQHLLQRYQGYADWPVQVIATQSA